MPTEVYIWEHLHANNQTVDLIQKQKLLQKINSIHPIVFLMSEHKKIFVGWQLKKCDMNPIN